MATLSDTVFTLDVSEDLEIENFKVNLKKRGSSNMGVGEVFQMSPSPVRALYLLCLLISFPRHSVKLRAGFLALKLVFCSMGFPCST